MWKYRLNNLRFGDRPILCDPRVDRIYTQWWAPALVFVGGAIVLGVIAGVVATGLFRSISDDVSPYLIIVVIYAGLIPFVLLYVVCSLIYSAGVRNIVLNETIVAGRHAMDSRIDRWRYAWIAISNTLATIFTLGLARPWAAIRMARYLAGVTGLYATSSLDEFVGTAKQEGGAVGSEFMDVEGFDLGF
jgi:uncharacterized membrane protein YjgN (DUF898 family)